MILIIEVGHTGPHSEFCEEFKVRHHLTHVMMTVWNNSVHRMKLKEETE
jgi:Ubiquitin elongating factor core